MAPVKIQRVISCSSQDKLHTANNLLSSDGFKKWSTEKPGETKATVILQLESEVTIRGVDIGNNGSAFVEVLVGKSSQGDDEKLYQTLVVTSSFMTPSESRGGTNLYKMRMFSKEQLSSVTVDEKWDRVKVICTQPYNKTSTFGLSVLTLHRDGPSLSKPSAPAKIGNFNIRSEPVEEKVVSVFKPAQSSNKAEIVSNEGKNASALFSSLQSNSKGTAQNALEKLKDEGGKKTINTGSMSSDYLAMRSVVDISDDGPSSTSSKPVTPSKPAVTTVSPTPSSDTSKLLSGVVFVLSGFQNPYRSDLRELGVALGAQYSPDWSTTSTHLICSVPNTPKYNQVKGKGIIVSKSWLTECRKQSKRVSEKKFRMDLAQDDDSDDDDLQGRSKRKISGSDEDDAKRVKRASVDLISDDEPDQEVRSESENEVEENVDPYEAATDDETEEDVIKRLKLPSLPNFLSGHSFFLSPDVDQDMVHKLRRFIIGYGGKLNEHMSKDVRFVLTSSNSWCKDFNTAMSNFKHLKFLNTAWVMECDKEQSSVDKTGFYVSA